MMKYGAIARLTRLRITRDDTNATCPFQCRMFVDAALLHHLAAVF